MDVLRLLNEWHTQPVERRGTLRLALAEWLNHLIRSDFERLVQLLYRVDVPEQKLKRLLAENPGTDAGELLADLLLEREAEKQRLRKASPPPPDDAGEERW